METINIRDFSINKAKTVDDTPFGGGAGMIIKPDILQKALTFAKKGFKKNCKIFSLSPSGKKISQNFIKNLVSSKEIILICGRYEGIDQRFIDSNVDEEISIGDYVLSGGEIAASVVIDAILRNIDDVIGNKDSVNKDSHSEGRLKGHVFTRPSDYKGKKVPDVLLSGDHEKVNEWKLANSLWVTREKRPDLFKQLQLSEKEMILLRQYGDLLTKKHE